MLKIVKIRKIMKLKRAENERETGKDKKLEEFWRREELGREEISYDKPGNRNIKADGQSERGKLDEGSITKRKNGLKGTPKQRVTRGELTERIKSGRGTLFSEVFIGSEEKGPKENTAETGVSRESGRRRKIRGR